MMKGSIHPITQIIRVAVSALGDLGFDIVEAPELETNWYNFDSLRMTEFHPARIDHASFHSEDGRVMRTHTTNMQLRATELKKPPLRVMSFGSAYRNDATDATHDIVFTQIDCLAIDEGITLTNLLSVLDTFITRIFGNDVTYRFRPHNFPFTEPSIEVDVLHNGKWIELLGAGMVHPEVLANMKIDPTKYTGFAFGIGIDRLALMKWGVEDIRQLRANKITFLRQFKAKS